jgi:hypothetical protein
VTEIIGQIWALPFWQLVAIAIVDDLILLVRAWPFYAVVIGLWLAIEVLDRITPWWKP